MSDAADEAPLGNYEHLKTLEPLIGTWAGEWDIPQDRPTANIKKGKYTFTVTWKWDAKKSAILSHHSIGRPGAAPVWKAAWLIGWDTANKRIVAIGFEATGGHAKVDDWEIQGDKVTFKAKGSLPAGNKTSWTLHSLGTGRGIESTFSTLQNIHKSYQDEERGREGRP